MEKCSFPTQDKKSGDCKPESGIQSSDLKPNSDVEELKRIAQEFEKISGKIFIDELFGIKRMNEEINEQIRKQIGDQMNS